MHIYGSDDTFEECIDTMDKFLWDIVHYVTNDIGYIFYCSIPLLIGIVLLKNMTLMLTCCEFV